MPKHGLNAVDKDKAQYTIDLLNLNGPFLKAQRERYLVEIIAEIDKLVEDNALSGLENLAQCELTLTERQCPQITNESTDRASINKAPFLQLRAFIALFGQSLVGLVRG